MSSDPTPLAERLREVAHKADVETHNMAILEVTGKSMNPEEKAVVVSWARSTAVTVAALRELADEADFDDRSWHWDKLRELADSIERGGDDG